MLLITNIKLRNWDIFFVPLVNLHVVIIHAYQLSQGVTDMWIVREIMLMKMIVVSFINKKHKKKKINLK